MKTGSHSVYEIQYHIVWCPKFRYPVLSEYDETLKNILREICSQYHYEISALEVMPDHVHILLSAPQTVAPCDVVRTLKSISAIKMFKSFPELKKYYAKCGRLWTKSYYIGTVGHTNEAVIKKYVETQKTRKN